MRTKLPLAIVLVTGIGMVIQFFIPHPVSKSIYNAVLDWIIIISGFTYVLAIYSLFNLHWSRISRKKENWGYSLVTITAMIITGFLGVVFGAFQPTSLLLKINPNVETTPLMVIYENMQMPMQATMFSLLAFFIASAAFRAFRARNLHASLLLGTALIVLLGRVPIGEFIWKGLPDFVEWILKTPSMAAQRGIKLGVGLGMISTALKIILGIERGYLGGIK